MDKTGDEAASKFISALIKSVQTLCHGYLDFQTGIEIIGHINLSVDKGSSLDYILKEKVCKNAENSTLFISNSFHAEPKSEQEVPGKQGQAGNQTVQNSEVADSGDSSKVSSAISSISSNLTGIRDRRQHSSGAKDSDSSYSHYRAGKRKASSDQMNDVCPAKVSSHHDSSRLSSDSPYRPNSSSPVDSKLGLQGLQTADGESSETMLPQTANVTDGSDIGVNLAGSVLEPVESQSNTDLPERDEDSDGDLEVTFIKEEYVEGDRSACEFDSSGQQYLGPHDRNSEGMPDPSVFPVALHSGSAPSTYVPSGHDPGAVGQQYPGGVPSQPQPGPSGSRGQWQTHPKHGGACQPYDNFTHQSEESWESDEEKHGRGYRAGSAWIPRVKEERDEEKTVDDDHVSLPFPRRDFMRNLNDGEKCKFCSDTFPSKLVLHEHMSMFHSRKYICSICKKGFTRKESYTDHVNVHNRIKAHKCPYCSILFSFKTNLRKHLRDGVCRKHLNAQFPGK
ncbi:uncharacterized protein LOC143293555 isoform X5 [Babylonia areolata]|uniref:uncharacterized protein LOC143293555 isoform X5 n=1 Tax=Babylonia areolata TaxID=304850 RepID=UPI003FD5F7FB